MQVFLKAMDEDSWTLIQERYMDPELLEGVEWTADQKKIVGNAKAMNAVYCALSREDFNRISVCESMHEIWNTLEVTYEGTSKVKETRISILTKNYECFRMQKEENCGKREGDERTLL
jgi:hypothetical protein